MKNLLVCQLLFLSLLSSKSFAQIGRSGPEPIKNGTANATYGSLWFEKIEHGGKVITFIDGLLPANYSIHLKNDTEKWIQVNGISLSYLGVDLGCGSGVGNDRFRKFIKPGGTFDYKLRREVYGWAWLRAPKPRGTIHYWILDQKPHSIEEYITYNACKLH